MTNNPDDLFDEEPKEESSNGSDGGDSGDGSGVSRRAFLQGTGGAAAAGAIIGVAGTLGVSVLTGDDDDSPSETVGTTTPSTGGTTAPAATMGVPENAAVADAVVTLNINGTSHRVSVDANESLAEVLRRKLNLTGTNVGCDRSECSACTVQIDGVATNSCSVLAIRQEGREILTIEGLEQDGVLSPVQEAFVSEMGLQCGFCTTGQIMQATALLAANPNPTETEIRRGMSGNLCKCSAYTNILAAVQKASGNVA